VLDFLLRVQPSQVVPYLEHLIYVWEEKSDIIHNALIHQYRAKIQQVLGSGEESKEEVAALRAKLVSFLETSHHYNPQVVIVQFPVDCRLNRLHLNAFLTLHVSGLFEERAILLGRMGLHENAISIYMRTLNDKGKAMQYCENVYQRKQEGYKTVIILDSISVRLLQILLRSMFN